MKQTQSRTKFQTPHEAKATMPAAKTPVKQPAKKPIKLRKGKLGELLGHSVVSVIRAMGKAGWDYDTARAALDKAGIEAAQHTVKVGMKRGRDGQKRIAPLSAKELDTLKVKKPAKGKGKASAA